MYHLIISFIFISNIFGDIIERPIQISSNSDYSLNFDGNDDMVIIENFEGNFSNFSFMTQAKISSIDNFQNMLFYFGASEGGDNSFTRTIDLGIDMDEWLRTNLNYDYGKVGTYNYTLNSWINISGVFDGVNNTLSFYINGELIETIIPTVDQIIFNQDDQNTIGSGWADLSGSITNFFNGYINYLAFWETSLTDDEIYFNYNNNPNFNDNNLIGFWKYNSDASDVLYDHSGNQNHGTIYGAEWVQDPILGDLNNDGILNILDIIVVANIAVGIFPYDETADLTGDGQVNILDVIFLVNLVLNS